MCLIGSCLVLDVQKPPFLDHVSPTFPVFDARFVFDHVFSMSLAQWETFKVEFPFAFLGETKWFDKARELIVA